jgi:hypothetical protein
LWAAGGEEAEQQGKAVGWCSGGVGVVLGLVCRWESRR